MEKTNTKKQSFDILKKRKALLSTLWVFVLINMMYADILSLMDPASPIRKIMEGAPLPPGGLIVGALLMETAIVMIILSHVLSRKVNRAVTTVIAAVNIFAVMTGGHGSYYIMFAAIETAGMLLIVFFAWKKPKQTE